MKRITSIFMVILAAVFLMLAGTVNRDLSDVRHSTRAGPVGVLEGAPPIMVFTTVVLGGFRGLIADMLWLRLSQLQDEGKYFELVQLANWITKLEPHLGKVWGHHAWNMAYNVSIMMPDEEERWKWVRNGIELLRDEGLVYNPDDKWLYFNLGWFFQHKIGQDSDDSHLYYKKMWAKEMTDLFGGHRPDFVTLEAQPELLGRMKEQYKLFPSVMLDMEREFGEFDWTRPESHSAYWAWMGKIKTGLVKDRWLDLMLRQSLRELGKWDEDQDRPQKP